MPNGFGYGGGRGFGFRGASPPWPYVGLGRGGFPRCQYPGAFTAPPWYGGYPAPGAMPYAPQVTPEQELDFLRSQAEGIKGQLDEIEARMRELESRTES